MALARQQQQQHNGRRRARLDNLGRACSRPNAEVAAWRR
jgi:hypothetical protein